VLRSLGLVVLIAGAAAGAYEVGRRPTITRGDVIAADLVEQEQAFGWKALRCDPDIPIGLDGATFHCHLDLADGDQAELGMTLDAAGQYRFTVESESAPEHKHVPASGDPWGD
jgi:hypothetical protein